VAGTKRGIDENSSNAANAENVGNRRKSKKAALLRQHVTPYGYPYDGSESDSTTEQTSVKAKLEPKFAAVTDAKPRVPEQGERETRFSEDYTDMERHCKIVMSRIQSEDAALVRRSKAFARKLQAYEAMRHAATQQERTAGAHELVTVLDELASEYGGTENVPTSWEFFESGQNEASIASRIVELAHVEDLLAIVRDNLEAFFIGGKFDSLEDMLKAHNVENWREGW
jgi:hypothetical protein